jgi:hypothetical protein
MRLRKVVHRACPMVCAPESAVMSRAERPLLPNMVMSVARLESGPGRLALAALWLAVCASRRPRYTVHVGPPSCIDLSN